MTLLGCQHEEGVAAGAELIKNGASVWLEGAITLGGVGLLRSVPPEALALGVTNEREVARRSLALKSALSSSHPGQAKLIQALASVYWEAVGQSNTTSLGALGKHDEIARDVCEVILSCEKEIESQAGPGEPERGRAREMLVHAGELFEAKRQAPRPDMDPKEIAKGATPQIKARLRALEELVSRCAWDDEFVQGAFKIGQWLKESPQLACVSFPSAFNETAKTLMGVAIQTGSAGALGELDAMGANLWLAAAQEGSSNACEWVFKKLLKGYHRELPCPELYASLLLNGAWLNGEEHPKRACLEMALKARPDDSEIAQRLAGQLQAALERVEICAQARAGAPRASGKRQGL